MLELSVLKQMKITKVMNRVASGTTEQKSSVLDMAGFDAVVFILSIDVITDGSVVTATVNENTASSTSTPTPTAIATSAATFTASTSANQLAVSEAIRPSKRYVFLDVTRITQVATIDCVIAIQFRSRGPLPLVQAAGVTGAQGSPEV